MNIEIHMETNPPYVITPVDDPGAVEDALPRGWCIGDGWWASSPDQKQPDGRWLLYLRPLTLREIPFDQRPRWPKSHDGPRATIQSVCHVCGGLEIYAHHHPG